MSKSTRALHVAVIILGDLGRSPRMLNHVRQLRKRGWTVTLYGYTCTPLPSDLQPDATLRVCSLDAGGAGRAMIIGRLAWQLACDRSWALAIVQNPPGFPALCVAWLAGRWRRAELILDWHNFGSTILAQRSSRPRFFTKIYAWCERAATHLANHHWVVSKALAKALPATAATVIYDEASPVFRIQASSVNREDRQQWWQATWPDLPLPPSDACWIVAPSSWGEDEDHAAMLRLVERISDQATRPLVLIATGQGPGRAAFEQKAARYREPPVMIQTAWAPPDAYPQLLGLADAGLCLHTSSSGLDLPMKLADFRGAALPALTFDYGETLREIFLPGREGWLFRNDAELAVLIRKILFEPSLLERMRTALQTTSPHFPESPEFDQLKQRIIDRRKST